MNHNVENVLVYKIEEKKSENHKRWPLQEETT